MPLNSYYIDLARNISSASKDPSTKVGAVIVSNKTGGIVSTGYNGFARGMADDDRLDCRPTKYRLVVHAEVNAICNSALLGVPLIDTSLYLYGTFICGTCAGALVQSGVNKVYIMVNRNKQTEVWEKMFEDAKVIFDECGVDYEVEYC